MLPEHTELDDKTEFEIIKSGLEGGSPAAVTQILKLPQQIILKGMMN